MTIGSADLAADLAVIVEEMGLRGAPQLVPTLLKYLDLLQLWNATYNLTAVRDRRAMLTQHLADCLAVVPSLARHAKAARVLDVGSGGGLPGVVLATALPGFDVTCVDAVGKKAAFVRQVAGSLELANLHAAHSRVESLKIEPVDIVTSRAFATLLTFTQLTLKHLAPGGVWVAMKGQIPTDEIAALPSGIEMFHVEHLQVPGLDAQRCLIWMRPRDSQLG
jgi:16S rRNA (guanine527-N7)-methyltransferase